MDHLNDLASIPNVPMTALDLPELLKDNIKISVLRLDKIDVHGSGNKYFKLIKHIEQIRKGKYQYVVSFGGAYSNHLHALSTAIAGLNENEVRSKHIQLIALVPETPTNNQNNISSPTLVDLKANAVDVRFVSRSDYRKRYEKEFLNELSSNVNNAYIIAEGAADDLGYEGASILGEYIAKQLECLDKKNTHIDSVIMACGTSSSMLGVLSRLPRKYSLLGVPVLKKKYFKDQLFKGLRRLDHKALASWSIDNNAQHLVYGQVSDDLRALAKRCLNLCDLPLDPIYNIKVIDGILKKIKLGQFAQGSHHLFIHTGGLQGVRGVENWPVRYQRNERF